MRALLPLRAQLASIDAWCIIQLSVARLARCSKKLVGTGPIVKEPRRI